jgi:hypothetical protein
MLFLRTRFFADLIFTPFPYQPLAAYATMPLGFPPLSSAQSSASGQPTQLLLQQQQQLQMIQQLQQQQQQQHAQLQQQLQQAQPVPVPVPAPVQSQPQQASGSPGSASALTSPPGGELELVKKERRLQKNRLAAKECRRKKKE